MNKSKKIIIIGGGIGGLATAALLGKEGFNVTLLEKNERIGGRAMIFKKNGFTFDMGPSWYHMPEVFEHFFSLFGNKPTDFYKLKSLDPQYRIFFGDDTQVTIEKNLEKNLKTFKNLENGGAENIKKYLNISKEQYQIVIDNVLYKNFDSVKTLLNPKLSSQLGKLKVFQNLESLVQQFVKNKKLQQILLHQGLFIGLNPKQSRGFMSLFSHIDLNIGVEYPLGGIYSFIKSLETLCSKYNVTITTSQDVSKIEIENNRAKKVYVNKKIYDADIVISNADYAFTEMHLLDKTHQTYPQSYWEKCNIAPSAFIIFLGTKCKLNNLLHHNYYFPIDWSDHFQTIAEGSDLPFDPLIYFSCTSKTDPTVAPPDHENVFITVAIPPGIKITDEKKQRYANHIIKKLERYTGEQIQKNIVTKTIFTIEDFQKTFNAYKGTSIGLSQTVMQSMMLRPKQKSSKVDNLYYVGQYTNPGIGMPMVLISAELVVQRILNEN